MYKKHFNLQKGCKTPFYILEKQMLHIGCMSWTVHSKYATEHERNNVLKKLCGKQI